MEGLSPQTSAQTKRLNADARGTQEGPPADLKIKAYVA